MSAATSTAAAYDVLALRDQFPVLKTLSRGKPLIYLDNGATTQKPLCVLDTLDHFLRHRYGTVHRGVYELSEQATAAFENARKTAQRFVGAADAHEIIFTSGCTDGLNLVAATWGRANLKAGDEVLLTRMEHHSNIVPWQMLRDEKGIVIRVVDFSPEGELDENQFASLLSEKTKLVSLTHVSNALGTVNPVARLAALAKGVGAVVVVDGAQSAAHLDVDVLAMGIDFFAFSGHKIYGPTGTGVLWGRLPLLEEMPPYRGGGDMILSVSFEKTVYAKSPARFEAGTPAIAEVIGLGAAMEFLMTVGRSRIAAHENQLVRQCMASLGEIPGVTLVGTAREKAGVVSFVMEQAHPHDIATVLDAEGVAIRAGHHCAQPVMDFLGHSATARASVGLYNTPEDIEIFLSAVRKVHEIFG